MSVTNKEKENEIEIAYVWCYVQLSWAVFVMNTNEHLQDPLTNKYGVD